MQITDFSVLNGPEPEAANEADLGRHDFLNMLIAQLENQDPLNPQDATEFTAQLAQFTSLEKLISIDQGLASVSESQQSLSGVIEGLASASLIGREALAVGNLFEVGEDGTLVSRPAFNLPEAADQTTLTVYDGRNDPVATLTLGPLAAGFQGLPDEMVDTLLADPDLEDPGVYRFEINGTAGDRHAHRNAADPGGGDRCGPARTRAAGLDRPGDRALRRDPGDPLGRGRNVRGIASLLVRLARRLGGRGPRPQFSDCLMNALQPERTSLRLRAHESNRIDGGTN